MKEWVLGSVCVCEREEWCVGGEGGRGALPLNFARRRRQRAERARERRDAPPANHPAESKRPRQAPTFLHDHILSLSQINTQAPTSKQKRAKSHPATGPAPPPTPPPPPLPSPADGNLNRSSPETIRAFTITSPVASFLSTES